MLRLGSDDGCRLLITVEDSRRIDGVVIAASARRSQPDLPILFLTDRAATPPLLERVSIGRLPRRPAPERLVAAVERLLEPPGFRGELALETFIELVRVLTAASASGALRLRHGGASGTIWLELGSVVHAALGPWKGVEAFHRMLRWTGGTFTLEREAPPERTISISAGELLRECARFLDRERALARGSSPGFSALAAQHFVRGLELVRGRRYAEAVVEWEEAVRLDLGNRSYRDHLSRLRQRLAGADSGPD
jgi:hypothetical protein